MCNPWWPACVPWQGEALRLLEGGQRGEEGAQCGGWVRGQVYPAGGGTPWREVKASREGGAKGYRANPHPFTLHAPPMAPMVPVAENRAQQLDGTTSSHEVRG